MDDTEYSNHILNNLTPEEEIALEIYLERCKTGRQAVPFLAVAEYKESLEAVEGIVAFLRNRHESPSAKITLIRKEEC